LDECLKFAADYLAGAAAGRPRRFSTTSCHLGAPSPAVPSTWPTSRAPATSDSPNKLINVPVSNVLGPCQFGRIAGAPLSQLFSVGPLSFGVGVNITVWSYVDQLNISVLADDVTIDDPHEVTDAMGDAFALIRQAAGTPAKVTP
jgi:hypothetical protein